MAKGKSALMVQGMGVGMRVLSELTERLRQRGKNEELLHFMTKPRFKKNLDQIVDAIIDCDWRIPASEMRDLTEKEWLKEMGDFNDENHREEVRNLFWSFALRHMGINYERFSYDSDEDPIIPGLFLGQLHNQPMKYPLLVHEGFKETASYKEYVVVDIGCKAEIFAPGNLINVTDIEYLFISDAKYFDFNR